ncbi:cupin-like domain-containing protein [Acidihalobacter ferrooxydans]|uniref:Cupin n=1 Tax=Acidihalobacter ferrooxydans TaxID=1765967 RepID=A0A1P8UIG6_9GAMM|nr:cupin-like domain-containing protein [Acidihalobacter ferrooxydans]APZ43551.1 cupin [Acidihalobacter ferrooxydans]
MKLQPVVREEHLSRAEFLSAYRRAQRPVVLAQLTADWPARGKWNFDYLREVAGDTVVPLYANRQRDAHNYQYAHAAEMPLRDYLDRLEAGESDLRVFSFNILSAMPTLARDFSFPDMGLKLFDKVAFLFAGGRGARVQMHFDIDVPELLLCHFGGRKRVMLFPPAQTRHIYRVPFSFSSLREVDYDQPDYTRFPALRRLEGYTAELGHGDVLYIPSGYWHYIVYEEPGFSVSLRALPRRPGNVLRMLHNLLFVRTIERGMRKLYGQRWVARNERRAVEGTNRRLRRSGV